jgi:hypothetical protein
MTALCRVRLARRQMGRLKSKRGIVAVIGSCSSKPASLLAGCVLAALLATISFAGADPQESVRLIAKDSLGLMGWCSEHAVYLDKPDPGLVWLDIATGQQRSLQLDKSWARLPACSPDGRWVITQNGGTTKEGGDPGCDPPADTELPVFALWDMRYGQSYVIGKGFADVQWSPDSKVLLHRFRPYCNLERDSRNWFALPRAVTAFQAVDVHTLIRHLLPPQSGWHDERRIGAMSWISSNEFVVQLPIGEELPLQDLTPFGAIVLVKMDGADPLFVQQLNLPGFRATWTLAIPQLPPSADPYFLEPYCTYEKPEGVSCLEGNHKVGRETRQLTSQQLDAFCQARATGDVAEFCNAPGKVTWLLRNSYNSTVLVERLIDIGGQYRSDLFQIESDDGGYLK